jgi:7,8-dihydro-6-hydroxymethylpterin-pyrophosphokinase
MKGSWDMVADPGKIQTAVSKLVRARLRQRGEVVRVQPAEDNDGDEYLLVTVQLSSADIDDESLERLLEDIEAEVGRLDERYPSVRFLDAA